jgi:hypothetical protein
MNNRRSSPSSQDIEELLREAAPQLRPELREQILRRCQPEAQGQTPHKSFIPRARLKWSIAAACLACATQWLVVSHLDARSEAVIHGSPPAPQWALTVAPARSSIRRSTSRTGRGWPLVLQDRALLLTALMSDSDSAPLWSLPANSQSS